MAFSGGPDAMFQLITATEDSGALAKASEVLVSCACYAILVLTEGRWQLTSLSTIKCDNI